MRVLEWLRWNGMIEVLAKKFQTCKKQAGCDLNRMNLGRESKAEEKFLKIRYSDSIIESSRLSIDERSVL